MVKKQTGKYNVREFRFKIRTETLICLLLILATGAVYLQVLNFNFVGYDDDGYVSENARVQRGLSFDNVIWAFQTTQKSNWHPLTWLSHMLDVEIFGLRPGGHHMTSVLFHVINSLLLFAVFKKMTGKVWQSGFVAALFALHPLHVESVAWVSERKDVLSMFFWMLTLWSYVRYTEDPRLKRYLPVVGFFSLGLMAKPMVVTLPFVLLLLDYWPLERIHFRNLEKESDKPSKRVSAGFLIQEKIPLFLMTLISCLIAYLSQESGGAVGSFEIHPFSERAANAIVSYLKYIQKTFWPEDLAVLYPYPGTIPMLQIAAAVVLMVGITLLAIRYLKQLPWFGVGWLWFLGTLIPVIGLVQVGVQGLADRYTYIPLTGLFIICAWGVPRLMAGWRFRRIAIAVLCAVLFPIVMFTAWKQIRYWQNSHSLFTHTLAVTSDNYVIHNNFGFELAEKGRHDEAIAHYRKALRINPDFEIAYLNLGKSLALQGNVDQSVQFYEALLKAKPGYAGVHHNLGLLLLRKGDTENAIDHFQKALGIDNNYAEAFNSLGAARLSQGNIKQAISCFRQALRIRPDFYEASNNLSKLENLVNSDRKIKLEFK